MIWSPQQGAALSLVAAWLRDPKGAQVFRLFGYAGTGKCLGIGTPILMHDGSIKRVEAVNVGDAVMGPDSKPRIVTGLGRGSAPLYRIVPTKGDPWICNEDHVLTLQGSKMAFYVGKVIDISLRDVLARWPKQPDSIWKLWRTGVEFPSAWQPVDPYFIGAWLGDGTSGNTDITSADQEMIDYCKALASRYCLECTVTRDPRSKANRIAICGPSGRSRGNVLRNETRRCLDVNGDKFIPQNYLIADRAQRLALLAGLVDTDGHLTAGCYEITTKYARLRDGILFLARSLGFAAYSSESTKTIKSIGFVGVYHRIMISGDISCVPCILPRKQASRRKQIKRVGITGFKVEPLGVGDYYGFTLDGDGRFLLGDFTVTHNTTLARHAALDAASVGWSVRFAAYTGKAASRLREKGCEGATTIHELAYELVGTTKAKRRVTAHDGTTRIVDEDRPKFEAVGASDLLFSEQALVVLDECSMVNDAMGRDLLALGCRFLVLGDPFQLPPIEGAGFFERVAPDVTLTEVHRTALDSPVLRFATHVRTGGEVRSLDWGDAKVVRCSRWSELDWETHEQVIVGRNVTRHAFNRAAHARVSKSPLPVEGERLICLRNQKRIGLMNGELGTVTQRLTQLDDEDVFGLTFERDGGKVLRIDAWKAPFVTGELPRFQSGPQPTVLDYGTAITCHKAQGSEWESVLVCDESSVFRADARRWLYTAATRAQVRLTVGVA